MLRHVFAIFFYIMILIKVMNIVLVKKNKCKEKYKEIEKENKNKKTSKNLLIIVIVMIIVLVILVGIAFVVGIKVVLAVIFTLGGSMYVDTHTDSAGYDNFMNSSTKYLTMFKYLDDYIYIVLSIIMIRIIYINVLNYKKIKLLINKEIGLKD